VTLLNEQAGLGSRCTTNAYGVQVKWEVMRELMRCFAGVGCSVATSDMAPPRCLPGNACGPLRAVDLHGAEKQAKIPGLTWQGC